MSGSLFPMQGMGASGTGAGTAPTIGAMGSGGLNPLIMQLIMSQIQGGGGLGGGGGVNPSPQSMMPGMAGRGMGGGMPPMAPGLMQPGAAPAPQTNPMASLGGGQGLQGLLQALKGSQQGLTPEAGAAPPTPPQFSGAIQNAMANPAMMGSAIPAMMPNPAPSTGQGIGAVLGAMGRGGPPVAGGDSSNFGGAGGFLDWLRRQWGGGPTYQ